MTEFPIFTVATGVIPVDHFTVEESAEQTLFVYQGAEAQVLVEVIANGKAVPSLVGKTLRPGAAVVFKKLPPGVGAGPGKVSGTGLVMRNGRVVRDVVTPETEASDLAFALAHVEETALRLLSLVRVGTSDEVLTTFLQSRSYGDPAIRAELIRNARKVAKDS